MFRIFKKCNEVSKIDISKYFEDEDFRSGYYRDNTFRMAIGQVTVQQFFSQLYAHASIEAEPHSGGRQMNGHFSTRSLKEYGSWKDLTQKKTSSQEISPTAGPMARRMCRPDA